MSGHVIVVVVKSLRVGECKMEMKMGMEMKEVKVEKPKIVCQVSLHSIF